jgi:hypothetical protein
MTTCMAKAAGMAEVVLIQEPAVRWVPDVRGGTGNVSMNCGKKCDGKSRMGQGRRSERRRREAEGYMSRRSAGAHTNQTDDCLHCNNQSQNSTQSGKREIGIRENNFLWVCSGCQTRIRSLIGIKRGIQWRDYGGLRDADIVSIELIQPNRTPVRIFNIYNRTPLAESTL